MPIPSFATPSAPSATPPSSTLSPQRPSPPPVAVRSRRDGPYDEVSYVPHPNPYNTSMEEPWNEVSGSNVGSDTKTRQVLQRLQVGQYISYFAKSVYRCPFCTKRLGGTDFNCLRTHAEDIGNTFPKVGTTVNVYSFRAKHRTLGMHLRSFQRVEISAGRMPPLKPKAPKGSRSNKWRQSQMG